MNKKQRHYSTYISFIILYCLRFALSLNNLLRLDNKNKTNFILYCSRLIVTLHR